MHNLATIGNNTLFKKSILILIVDLASRCTYKFDLYSYGLRFNLRFKLFVYTFFIYIFIDFNSNYAV